MNELKKRSEVVFLYDVRDANPNGDPIDENKPRIDSEKGINIVTDVRLKRTIRDYLANHLELDIWLIEETSKDGSRKTREEKLDEIGISSKDNAKNLLEKYIDLRLFGATIASKKKDEGEKGERVFTWIGPVQFKFGRSLHEVDTFYIKGTSVLPTKVKKSGGAFTEMYILPYSLIAFYGIINENAGKLTALKEQDVDLLMDGIWNGTKNLITRSKVGQIPRFLIKVDYSENSYHIGGLDEKITLVSEKAGRDIRKISDYKLDVTELKEILEANKKKIARIGLEVDESVTFMVNGEHVKGKNIIEKLGVGLPIEKLNLDK